MLLVEVDNCTESPERLAAKFDRYRDYFRRKAKDARGREVPVWRTLYPPTGREGHPPIAVVFNPGIRTGEQALKNRMNRVLDLTRDVWSGRFERMGGLLRRVPRPLRPSRRPLPASDAASPSPARPDCATRRPARGRPALPRLP